MKAKTVAVKYSGIEYPCGCVSEMDKMEYCPLHGSAPDLLQALKDMLSAGPLVKLNVKNGAHYTWMVSSAVAQKAIRKAEGRK